MGQENRSEADSLPTRKYAFEISMEKGHISGIMITKEDTETIVGSMVNEFGVSALSFVYNKQKNKMKLQDVMKMLNKWYIKRVLKQDLTYCLHILYGTPYDKKNGYLLTKSAAETSITNTKRKITYSFSPLGTI